MVWRDQRKVDTLPTEHEPCTSSDQQTKGHVDTILSESRGAKYGDQGDLGHNVEIPSSPMLNRLDRLFGCSFWSAKSVDIYQEFSQVNSILQWIAHVWV